MTHLRLVTLAAATALLLGCAYANINDHVQFYEGDAQTDQRTALIQGGSLHYDSHVRDRVRLVKINQRTLPDDGANQLPGADSATVLPGFYTVDVVYLNGPLRETETLKISAHPGCKYRIAAYYWQQQVVFDVLPSLHGGRDVKGC